MNNIEYRALMGDKQAQDECTSQEILLPCPFCGNDKNIISNWGMWRCWCPNCLAKAEESLTQRGAIKSWNNRTAPLIGRCGECAHWHKHQCVYGPCDTKTTNEDFFCCEFEPK